MLIITQKRSRLINGLQLALACFLLLFPTISVADNSVPLQSLIDRQLMMSLPAHAELQVVLLQQVGNGNYFQANQQGTGNRIDARQHGNGHSASITQVGNGNVITLGQFGDANGITIEQFGHQAMLSIEQY